MTQLKSVEYKNLQSVGNFPMKIDLTRNSTTMVYGHNGAGKSLLGIAICYCLFGRFPSGMTLQTAINSTNKKNLLVTINFESRGKEYQVVRGEKPKKFEIYVDGELMDQDAKAKDQQAKLDMILGFDYKMYTQMIFLNKEKYVPFMEMKSPDRRKYVEEILNISVFSYMNAVCKKRSDDNKREVNNMINDRRAMESDMKAKQDVIDHIEESMNQSSQKNKELIEEKKNEISEYQKENDKIQDELDSISVDGHEKVKKQKQEFEKLAVQFEGKINDAKKVSAFFQENDHCITCEQTIDESLKIKKKNEADETITEVTGVVSDMMEELKTVIEKDNEYKERKERISSLNMSIRENNLKIENARRHIKDLEKSSNDSNNSGKLKEYVEDLESLQSDYSILEEEIENKMHEGNTLDFMRNVLKDDGIKAVIIREYIDLINKKINLYLQSMNYYVNMVLDENFNESFHALHKENFTMNNLSTGQKSRVNLSIWLALLEVASIKNSVVCNLLFLDEILENMDTEGVKDFMNLCSELLSDKNIFVVTQRADEFKDMFRSSIGFKLNEGYTEII